MARWIVSVRVRVSVIVSVIVILMCLQAAQGQESANDLQVHGYVKYLPSVRFGKLYDGAFTDQLLHNRFNLQYNTKGNFTFKASLRTRLFYGNTVRDFSFFPDFLEQDPGLVDASFVLWQQDSWLLHTTSDRFNIDWRKDNWQVTVGRQRINWGINMVSNPNDLFNTYSFFDFDYEERPGTDAIRIQHFSSTLSRWEVAVSPAHDIKRSVVAALYSFNHKGYDIQFVSGFFRNRYAIGTGWAGNIRQSGFKGELTYFTDLQPQANTKAANIVATIALDHRFSSGLFIVTEYLYNQQRGATGANPFLLTEPFAADNLSFTDHAAFANASYPISPVVSVALAGFYYPSEQVVFLSPNINASLQQNLDLLIISQIFAGNNDSLLSQAGYLVAGALKWSF